MTLQASGVISINDINLELGKAGTDTLTFDDADYRSLLEISSGQISLANAFGKSKAPAEVLIPSPNYWTLLLGPSLTSVNSGTNGDIYVSGTMSRNGSKCGFIACINKFGIIQWCKTIYPSGLNAKTITEVTVNNIKFSQSYWCVYITGMFMTQNGDSEAFIARFDADGTFVWERNFVAVGNEGFTDIAIDPDNDAVYFSGYTTTQGKGMSDAFVVKYSDAGTLGWQRAFGGTNVDSGVRMDIVAGATVSSLFLCISYTNPADSLKYYALIRLNNPDTTPVISFQKSFWGAVPGFPTDFKINSNLSVFATLETSLNGLTVHKAGITTDIVATANHYDFSGTNASSYANSISSSFIAPYVAPDGTSYTYVVSNRTSFECALSKFDSTGALIFSATLTGIVKVYGICATDEGIFIIGDSVSLLKGILLKLPHTNTFLTTNCAFSLLPISPVKSVSSVGSATGGLTVTTTSLPANAIVSTSLEDATASLDNVRCNMKNVRYPISPVEVINRTIDSYSNAQPPANVNSNYTIDANNIITASFGGANRGGEFSFSNIDNLDFGTEISVRATVSNFVWEGVANQPFIFVTRINQTNGTSSLFGVPITVGVPATFTIKPTGIDSNYMEPMKFNVSGNNQEFDSYTLTSFKIKIEVLLWDQWVPVTVSTNALPY